MSELAGTPFDPSAQIPFHTYRRFEEDGSPGPFDLAATLVHHYESEKFRGVSEELRLEALDCSSIRALRKLTKRHSESWRKDWRQIRGRVFRAGLAMQVLQSREALKRAREGFQQSMELAATKTVGGLPGAFLAEELQGFFASSTGPTITRLGVIALKGCVPHDIEDRLAALFGQLRPVSAAVYAGADADPTIERWCAKSAIPVRLTGTGAKRLREDDAGEVTQRVNMLVTCIPMARKASVAIVKSAQSRRPRVRVLDLAIRE